MAGGKTQGSVCGYPFNYNWDMPKPATGAAMEPPSDEVSYQEWIASLPKCVGYEGKCDGDLPGEEHEPHCPMLGKLPATLKDAFEAGVRAAAHRSEPWAQPLRELIGEWRTTNDYDGRAGKRTLLRCAKDLEAALAATSPGTPER